MSTSGYPPGWEADYDGETERWFYTHKPTGVRQYHFPKAGDEVELAAAMSRTKTANETKRKESNRTEGLKGLATARVAPGTSNSQAPDAVSVQQVQSSPFPTREDLSGGPAIRRSVSERATPTSPQPIPNVFRQSFQAAQRTDGNTAQKLPFQQASLTALPPLNTQLHGTSRSPYQVASSAHPLRINTNALDSDGNVSPVQSMSAGPWSNSASRGPVMNSTGHGAPYLSQGSQRTSDSSTPVARDPLMVPPKALGSDRTPPATSKHIGHTSSQSLSTTHDNASETLSSRLGILYLSDSDKEDVIANLQNLARMYPDVTLSQLIDPHMELPRAKVPGLPSSSREPSSIGSARNGKFHGAARDTSPATASAILADTSLPIAFVAYSREPQPTHRTYTSPVAGPDPSFVAPSPSSSFDYQRRHHSTSSATIASTPIQTSHDRAHSSSFSSRRQDSIGTQTYSPQTRTELAQTAWGLKPGSATTEGPGMTTSIPARPATTTPIQTLESSPDALGTRPSRQRSIGRKPLSSQSPIMNRPYRSLSWQPRDHSPNPQLPSSLVSEVLEEPSTPPRNATRQGSLAASDSSDVYSEGALRPAASPEPFASSRTSGRISGTEIGRSPPSQIGVKTAPELHDQEPTEASTQQAQEKSEADQTEFDRLNSIIQEQNRQLALLHQQNIQHLQDLQSQQNATVLNQGRQPENLGPQRHSSVPAPPSTRSSIYTQSSLQNTHYPPSYPSVPVSPISRPESLVNSIRDEQIRPLSLSEPTFDSACKSGDMDGITNSNLSIDGFEEDSTNLPCDISRHIADRLDQAPIIQSDITLDKIEQESGVDGQEVICHQLPDTTNVAPSIGDRSESCGSNQTESERESWSHVQTHSSTQQMPGQNVLQTDTNVRDRSESPRSNQTESKRGSWSHVRTHSTTQQIPDQTLRQISAEDGAIPAAVSGSVQTAGFLVTQEISSVPPKIYELQTQPHYMAQARPASQSQAQSVLSYQNPNVMSQSAADEINLQKALETQIQQHFEAVVSPQSAISPPDPTQSLYGVSSDSAVSDMSTPGLVHKEYFDPVSVQNSQVTAIAQRRISKDLSAPASIAEVVEPVQGHARKPSIPKYPTTEGAKYYEEKQVFCPDHAPLKTSADHNTGLQNRVLEGRNPPVPENTVEVSTGSSLSGSVINDGPEHSDAAVSSQPGQFAAFSRSRDNIKSDPRQIVSPLRPTNSQANTNTNQTHTHSPNPSVSSWSDMAKPSSPPHPRFTFGMPGEKQDDSAAAESLYDGDGYGDYDYYSDEPTPPQFVTPQPHLLQVRRST